MSVIKDAIVLGSYVVGSVGALSFIGVNLIGQAIEENSSVIVADVQATSVTLSIDTLAAMLPACEHEDTVPDDYACLWDATTRGNGEGASFIALADGSVIYLSE